MTPVMNTVYSMVIFVVLAGLLKFTARPLYQDDKIRMTKPSTQPAIAPHA